jgi:hypothetical protein
MVHPFSLYSQGTTQPWLSFRALLQGNQEYASTTHARPSVLLYRYVSLYMLGVRHKLRLLALRVASGVSYPSSRSRSIAPARDCCSNLTGQLWSTQVSFISVPSSFH